MGKDLKLVKHLNRICVLGEDESTAHHQESTPSNTEYPSTGKFAGDYQGFSLVVLRALRAADLLGFGRADELFFVYPQTFSASRDRPGSSYRTVGARELRS